MSEEPLTPPIIEETMRERERLRREEAERLRAEAVREANFTGLEEL